MNLVINRKTAFQNLQRKDYKQTWDYQVELFEKILAVKKINRDLPREKQLSTENYLLFVEHPHVYTLGKSGDDNHLLIRKEDLYKIDATFHHINRGGDITYHGPGQIVGYPIIDLENFFTDIHQYMRLLEESVIMTLASYGIAAGRISGLTGVWIEPENQLRARKICALGVKTSRWVTMHGFALNVNTDLKYFDHIVPCGIKDKDVTSLSRELGCDQDVNQVAERLKKNIYTLFEMELS
ncbi:MAG TPA: lipoyl(octanoyl) transferase LipB [Cyclobacteriaceae bacterium]|nr:lipoyl(octanoyl) transferase LipB [Cyclobacteriaceae bacterium]